MALIECPECGNQVSNRASACPHCGFPITKISSSQMECPNCGMLVDKECEECPICGYLLKQTVGVSNNRDILTTEDTTKPTVGETPAPILEITGNAVSKLDINGSIKIWAYEDGIKIGENKNVSIHQSQIINVFYERTIEKIDVEKDKSVIKRAAVGGLLMGPVGAIVGGMSGIGTKHSTELSYGYRLIIEYIDSTTNAPSQLVTECSIVSPVSEFVKKYKKK